MKNRKMTKAQLAAREARRASHAERMAAKRELDALYAKMAQA